MGFFGGGGRITHHEFRKALFHLKEKGFSQYEIEQVESAFRGDLDEPGLGSDVSKEELDKGIRWFKEHPNEHHLPPRHIEKLEEILRHYL